MLLPDQVQGVACGALSVWRGTHTHVIEMGSLQLAAASVRWCLSSHTRTALDWAASKNFGTGGAFVSLGGRRTCEMYTLTMRKCGTCYARELRSSISTFVVLTFASRKVIRPIDNRPHLCVLARAYEKRHTALTRRLPALACPLVNRCDSTGQSDTHKIRQE